MIEKAKSCRRWLLQIKTYAEGYDTLSDSKATFPFRTEYSLRSELNIKFSWKKNNLPSTSLRVNIHNIPILHSYPISTSIR